MARGFVFSLQAVLDVRLQIEKQRQQTVALIESQRSAVDQRVRQIQQEMAAERQELRTLVGSGGAVAMHSVRLAANASLHAVVRLQRAVIELAGVCKRLEAARADLLKAAVQRKAVETLRARQLEAWKKRLNRLETDELDDLTCSRIGVAAARGAGQPAGPGV